MDNTVLLYRLKTLTAFRDLLAEPVLSVAVSLLDALSSGDAATALTNWAELVSRLDQEGSEGLGPWLEEHLKYSDAPWPRSVDAGEEDPRLEAHALRDLETLTALSQLDPRSLSDRLELPAAVALPGWSVSPPFSVDSLKRHYRAHGCGPFARCRAFL